MPAAKRTRLGPYEIAAAIGAGGMGEVYRARDTRLDRYVAIKIIHSNLPCTPEFRTRFEREARTLSSLSHPHICSLYDVGKEGNLEFLVMELLDGETLANRLRKGPLPVSAVVKLGIEIADALAAAHRLGVIHRDLKPANIMLTANGAKLMDFGLAKPSVASDAGLKEFAEMATATMQSPPTPLSGANTLIGTIQYMAPEQIEGKGAPTSRNDPIVRLAHHTPAVRVPPSPTFNSHSPTASAANASGFLLTALSNARTNTCSTTPPPCARPIKHLRDPGSIQIGSSAVCCWSSTDQSARGYLV